MQNIKEHFFYCNLCDFKCYKKGDYNRHLTTSKHESQSQMALLATKYVKKTSILHQTIKQSHDCNICNKTYKTRSGLWRHSKMCIDLTNDTQHKLITCDTGVNENLQNTQNTQNLQKDETLSFMMNLFHEQMNDNKEFKKIMMEQNNNIIEMMSHGQTINNNTINSINNTTTNNNQFNLNLFLNETCKDAMNINDFIDYVNVKLEDFEYFGEVGYSKALGEIIVRNLNELDVKMRPVHCSDLKREVLYIKHDGVWHNDEAREFMKRSIMYIAHKNIKQIPKWQEANPESKDCHTKTFEKYNKMFRASLGPIDDEEKNDFLKKITSIVAKEAVIDKKKKY